jgi:hypothetical protein
MSSSSRVAAVSVRVLEATAGIGRRPHFAPGDIEHDASQSVFTRSRHHAGLGARMIRCLLAGIEARTQHTTLLCNEHEGSRKSAPVPHPHPPGLPTLYGQRHQPHHSRKKGKQSRQTPCPPALEPCATMTSAPLASVGNPRATAKAPANPQPVPGASYAHLPSSSLSRRSIWPSKARHCPLLYGQAFRAFVEKRRQGGRVLAQWSRGAAGVLRLPGRTLETSAHGQCHQKLARSHSQARKRRARERHFRSRYYVMMVYMRKRSEP